jgi:hypothetical protein
MPLPLPVFLTRIVNLSFFSFSLAGGDEPDHGSIRALGVDHKQQPLSGGPDQIEPLLAPGVRVIYKHNRMIIIKGCAGFIETDLMPLLVERGLVRVPVKLYMALYT